VSPRFVSLIHATVPGKPIRYVVISHHHSDHLGGLRAFAGEGATVIVAPAHAAAARIITDATIETVASHRVITDGTRSLEIWNVGSNPHTDENLFVWLPTEGVLFQGDLFYYGKGDPFPPSGRQTMNRFFARWLEAHGIAPRAIYGVHNAGAAGPQRLVESLGAL
jgi:glyoxylase-like metal-dependent hydrolase (beta-lactamase superfamily II)